MNVFFVHLPLARRSFQSQFALPEPLTQMYLAPALSARHRLRFVDMRLERSLERALDRLEEFRPDVAVVGINPLTLPSLGRVLGELRSRAPGLKILLHADAEYGNSHVSERPQDFLHPQADALVVPYFIARQQEIVSGTLEAWQSGREPAVPGLWVHARGTWRATEHAANVVGRIGVPDRTLLGEYRGRYRFAGIGRMAHLFYTYGCLFKCRFCPMSKHDGSIVTLPVDGIVQDLRAITEPHVFLEDYEPFLVPEAMSALADAVEQAGIRKRWYMLTRADSAIAQRELIARWKRLGLSWLYLGLDGDSARRLKEIKKSSTVETNEKALRAMLDLGLAVTVGFVVRSDYTREDFAALRAYVRHLGAPLVTFTVETPLVGTTLFDEAQRDLTTRDWSLFDLEHAVLPTALPLDEFYRELARLHATAGLRTMPAMLQHYPLRDVARSWMAGAGLLWRLRHAARDHEPRRPESLVAGPSPV